MLEAIFIFLCQLMIIPSILQQQKSLPMDIDEILQIIPLSIQQWTPKQVQVWLTYIQLSRLIPKFKQLYINGPRLLNLNPQYIDKHMHIKSNVIKKKLMNWIQYLGESQQYCNNYLQEHYLQHLKTNMKETVKPQSNVKQLQEVQCYINDALTTSSETTLTASYIMRPSPQRYNYIPNHETLHIQDKFTNDGRYIACDQTSITFGKNPNNNFFIPERDVQSNHCTIIHRQNHHILCSSHRNSGIWVKVYRKIKITDRQVLQMGQSDFYISAKGSQLSVTIQGGYAESEQYFFSGQARESFRIGRRNNCDIIISLDNTLSGIHGKFIYDSGNWFFQDLQTTNGSWRRCREEQKIEDKMMFRIGKTKYIYNCRLYSNDQCKSTTSSSSQLGTCRQCRENQKNCYFRPCYHNQFCYDCSGFMTYCPICKEKIHKTEKIYKL